MNITKLARSNPHPRDGTVKLDPSSHLYKVDGIDRSFVSVTTLVKWYLPSIDPDRLADSLLVDGNLSWRGMRRDEIVRKWEEKGREARCLGTRFHSAIEMYYNGVDPINIRASIRRECWDGHVNMLSREWAQFLLFDDRYTLTPFRTEMPIYSVAYRVAGTVDFLARNSDGSVSLYDWKRSKADLGAETSNWDENGVGPLRSYPNTCYSRYSLQLNMYRIILEEEYDLIVKDMYIVRFHPEVASYEIFVVLRTDHALQLLSHYRHYSTID